LLPVAAICAETTQAGERILLMARAPAATGPHTAAICSAERNENCHHALVRLSEASVRNRWALPGNYSTLPVGFMLPSYLHVSFLHNMYNVLFKGTAKDSGN